MNRCVAYAHCMLSVLPFFRHSLATPIVYLVI